MTLRAQAAARRRRIQAVIGAAVAVLVVVGGIVWLVVGTGGKKSATPGASASPEVSQSAYAAHCTWLPVVDPSATPTPEPLPKEIKDVGKPPETGEPRSGIETMTITTNLGVIKVAVDTAKAPCTAASFTYLASKEFYDNTKCHRMTTAGLYVLQCGDPSATGRGGPAYRLGEENLPVGKRPAYPEGVVAMAKGSSPASTSSQFFIVYKDTELNPDYTVVGRITEGLDLVKKVAEAGVTPLDPNNPSDGTPKTEVKIISLTMSAPAQAS